MIFYAMSHQQDYFAGKVERFVALAACTVTDVYPNLPKSYRGLTAMFNRAYELGYFNLYG